MPDIKIDELEKFRLNIIYKYQEYHKACDGPFFKYGLFLNGICNKMNYLITGLENSINTSNKITAEILLRCLYEVLITLNFTMHHTKWWEILKNFQNTWDLVYDEKDKNWYNKRVRYTHMDNFFRDWFKQVYKEKGRDRMFNGIYDNGSDYIHFSMKNVYDNIVAWEKTKEWTPFDLSITKEDTNWNERDKKQMILDIHNIWEVYDIIMKIIISNVKEARQTK